eukprot:CFRG0133T1
MKLHFTKLEADLNKKFGAQPHIKKATEKTGVSAAHVVLAGSVVAFLLSWCIFGAHFVTTAVAVAYPSYASVMAIESHGSGDESQWLTYWVIFGFLSLAEFLSDIIVYYVPFYYYMKLAFTIWLFLPSTKGATVVYTTLIKPHVKSTSKFSEKASNVAQDIKESVEKVNE